MGLYVCAGVDTRIHPQTSCPRPAHRLAVPWIGLQQPRRSTTGTALLLSRLGAALTQVTAHDRGNVKGYI